MNFITNSIRAEREYGDVLSYAAREARKANPLPLLVTGMCDGARIAFYLALAEDCKKRWGRGFPLIVPDEKEAAKIAAAFSDAGMDAFIYPLRDFLFHNITASHEYEHERLSVLSAALSDSYDIVIATPDAALQYTVPRDVLLAGGLTLRVGGEYRLGDVLAHLERSGYARVDMVNGAGQYSVRGGILDIFPPRCEYPCRAEFFGDEIDKLAIFDILTQRRIEETDEVSVTPAREIILDATKRAELEKIISAQIKKIPDENTKSALNGELEAVRAGTELNFIDKYISFVYPEKTCMLDYFDAAPFIVIEEWNAVSDRLKSFEWHMRQALTELLENGAVASRFADYNKWESDFSVMTETRATVIVDNFARSIAGKRLADIFSLKTKQTVSYADNIEMLREDLTYYRGAGFKSLVLCETETYAKNLRQELSESGFPAALDDDGTDGVIRIVYGRCFAGYELTTSKFALLSMYHGSGSSAYARAAKKRGSKAKKSSKEKIMSYADLNVGDYVVHESYGVGQYLGLESLTVEGAIKDFVKIKYAGTDMLYLPINQFDLVSKYIGAHSEDGLLKLSKMGGTDWVKSKNRAKAATKAMAKELIALYAERQRREGFAFLPDDEYQGEFEAAFEYDETDGQLLATDEIKRDMEQIVPMDRLLCGDVGFGKTEVALRAAFKAVSSGKQVAILVPTTILALQHYQTLLSRMRSFPIKIDMLSRFRSPKQQNETLRRLRRGEIDIIVGTHRIVSKDVVFRDLGLVIIDEEQRFGVAHKEKLKQISYNVDVLTLTATPIPRTLNMAMSGIRDMSILEEAPGERFPVQTYVLEYDDMIIAEAIKKELRRGGQVFFLHNRVETIHQTAARVAAMAPDARVAVAHGQMDREMMSDIWRSMVDGDVDVLVSTTIIETGIDVPNANTLIIEHADHMGLSQLHQIRGRIGRSNRRAYAYFTYPRGAVLTEIAEKRLSAIRDYTEFGSGFKIALRDLEIRGAGNLLGAEQHGHIDTVGYDLYMKLLSNAILEERGQSVPQKSECTVDINFDAYISDKYIYMPAQRIDAYKKIASIENDEDLSDIRDELYDRYGEMPAAVENLLNIALIRAMGCVCRIAKIEQVEHNILIRPEHLDAAAWSALAGIYRGKLLMNVSAKPYISLRVKKDERPLDFLCELFKKYIQITSENIPSNAVK